MPKYKRPMIARSTEPSKLFDQYGHYKELSLPNDEGWVQPYLKEVHQDALFGLGQLSSTIDRVKQLDLREYKEDIARQKKALPIVKAKSALLSFLSKHIKEANDKLSSVQQEILRLSEPPVENHPVKATIRNQNYIKITELIHAADPRRRADLIKAGGKLYLEAIICCGDIYRAFPLIDEKTLTDLRREYAFEQDDSLQAYEKDTKIVAEQIRRRCAEIYSTGTLMGMEIGVDDDVPPAEFFEVFPPRDSHEKAYADQRIQAYNRKVQLDERRAKWEQTHQGMNFEVQDREKRTKGGALNRPVPKPKEQPPEPKTPEGQAEAGA